MRGRVYLVVLEGRMELEKGGCEWVLYGLLLCSSKLKDFYFPRLRDEGGRIFG